MDLSLSLQIHGIVFKNNGCIISNSAGFSTFTEVKVKLAKIKYEINFSLYSLNGLSLMMCYVFC